MSDRLCAHCGTALKKKAHEAYTRFERRETCNIVCRTALHKAHGHPPCVVCGGEMKRQPTEGGQGYRRRMTCSRTCASKRNAAGSYLVRQQRRRAGSLPFMGRDTRVEPAPVVDQPKGCVTVDEFLAKGGFIRRIEPSWVPQTGGIPVRSKIGNGTGRVP